MLFKSNLLHRITLLFVITAIASGCRPSLDGRMTKMTGNWYPYSTSCISSDNDAITMIQLYVPGGDSNTISAMRYKGMISENITQAGSFLMATYRATQIDNQWINLDHVDVPTTKTTMKSFPRKNEDGVAVLLLTTLKNGKQQKRLYSFEPVAEKECDFEHPLTKRK